MPIENKTPTYLKVLLLVVVFISFSLGVLYMYQTRRPASPTASSQDSKVVLGKYEGYIQELVQKPTVLDGVNYTYLIGLLGTDSKPSLVWITAEEFSTIKAYNSKFASRTPIDIGGIKGGTLLRVTRYKDTTLQEPNTFVEVEMI